MGIATGVASGLLVIDIDPRNGGDVSYEHLRIEYPASFAELLEVWTGSGGTHLYFECRSPTPSRANIHPGIDVIILEISFIQGRPKETRLALLKDINTRVAAAASVSPDDMLITLYEVPGENISFGQGETQRANAVARA